MLNKLYQHFIDLGFYPQDDFHLGPRIIFIKRTVWESIVYSFLAFGIICRELLKLGPLRIEFSGLSWGTVGGSLVLAAPLFPFIIRQITKHKPQGGIEYIAIPFSCGLSFNYVAYMIKIGIVGYKS